LTFSQVVTGLSASDITLSGVSGAGSITKTLSGSGPVYTLTIGNVTAGGTLSVAVTKSGYNIAGTPKTVDIIYTLGTQTGSASFTLTFAKIADAAPSISSGITIYRTSTKTPTSATFSVTDPSQYSKIVWYINGAAVQGQSLTVQSMSYDYYSVGEHFLTLEVTKNGVPYTKRVTFTVAN